MKVKVNGKVIDIFRGAKVRDVLRAYSDKELHAVETGKKKVLDSWGNEVDLDGALAPNSELFVQ